MLMMLGWCCLASLPQDKVQIRSSTSPTTLKESFTAQSSGGIAAVDRTNRFIDTRDKRIVDGQLVVCKSQKTVTASIRSL